jgi:NAD(P)-dependent dehydrogenase (short-subunit alcohol dehydrogenase family)
VRRFGDRVALVTGAASGLGLAVARQLAAEGASLVLVDWDASGLEAAAVRVNASGHPKTLTGDVSAAGTASAAVELARSSFGRLDVLVNNAGIDPLRARSIAETSDDDWDRILDVNTKSAFLFARAAIPLMKAGGGGSIVCTASTAGLRATGAESAYSVSKAALISLTRSIALDFAADGIRANCVCPGFMEMVMTDRRRDLTPEQQRQRSDAATAAVPMRREGRYEEVARAVVFLAGPDASYITGTELVIDGGLLLR